MENAQLDIDQWRALSERLLRVEGPPLELPRTQVESWLFKSDTVVDGRLIADRIGACTMFGLHPLLSFQDESVLLSNLRILRDCDPVAKPHAIPSDEVMVMRQLWTAAGAGIRFHENLFLLPLFRQGERFSPGGEERELVFQDEDVLFLCFLCGYFSREAFIICHRCYSLSSVNLHVGVGFIKPRRSVPGSSGHSMLRPDSASIDMLEAVTTPNSSGQAERDPPGYTNFF